MKEIADTTIEKLKKNEAFERWSDKRFERLREILMTELSDEEDENKLSDALTKLLMEEE